MKLSHIVDGNNVIDLEYNFTKKEDLENLYRQYRSFATDTPSMTPLPLLYKQITNLELKTYQTYWQGTNASSPIILDLSVDKGTTGASLIPWASANTKLDLQPFTEISGTTTKNKKDLGS